MMKFAIAAVAVAIALLVARFVILSASAKPPDTLGADAGRLAPCPESSNCVSSQATDAEHRIEPLAVPGPTDQALEAARRALEAMRGTTVVERDGPYLRVEVRSRLFRFVDDLELLYDPRRAVFDVRSASRVGHSDLGVNRRRVEALRRRLAPG